jgi:hypothetical protein|tara:strand:+ start:38895 stop:39290 length:396 start_codon:yes stop_codon:yes gene_type:complete
MKRPYSNSALAEFITRRVLELRPRTQIDIATAAGFENPNMVSMLKSGATKLPLDRVLAMAAALDTDPRRLFMLALGQHGYETQQSTVEEIFQTVITTNEKKWLFEIRDASNNTDPVLTTRSRVALRGIFNK